MPLTKGAFVVFQAKAPVPTDLILFQFNSETVARRIQPPSSQQQAPSATPGTGGTAHTPGPPTETYQLTIDLDATDHLAVGHPITGAVGVHPALAQLELLLYPPSTLVLLNKALALAGSAMLSPQQLPMVLFVWGAVRVLPVQITSLSVTEQGFDALLNPIQAKVEVGFSVLTDSELAGRGAPWTALGTVMHIAKEALSRLGTAQNAANINGLLPF